MVPNRMRVLVFRLTTLQGGANELWLSCDCGGSVCCKSCRKDMEVQPNRWGVIRLSEERGIYWCGELWGFRACWKNCLMWFLESKSAASLFTPTVYMAVKLISNIAVENHKQWRRCMTKVSFTVPLLIATTKLWLSHWNSVLFLAKRGPQTAQLRWWELPFCHDALYRAFIWPAILKSETIGLKRWSCNLWTQIHQSEPHNQRWVVGLIGVGSWGHSSCW